jgi:hypothetical protein
MTCVSSVLGCTPALTSLREEIGLRHVDSAHATTLTDTFIETNYGGIHCNYAPGSDYAGGAAIAGTATGVHAAISTMD